MNWMQVEAYLQHDDRAVLPLGSTEQHSHLRLTVDCILPERVAADAAEPLGVPVFPVVAYGVTPYFPAGSLGAREAAADGRPRQGAPARPGRVACIPRRRQLRRPLTAARYRHARALARRGRRNTGAADGIVGRSVMRFLIWGAGAIGGTMGAHLARAGHDITLVDIDGEHVAAINRSGLGGPRPSGELS